ncbi:MAG: hypothetical protein COA69_12320 [Robiginitomaculum sp.]|nr:MAG: hypothetical protein COA69_12320 [Robiginitomaculum sp.]
MNKTLILSCVLAMGVSACGTQVSQAKENAPAKHATEMEQTTQTIFKASDGESVYSDFYASAQGKEAPLILLFHQAGANGRGEYANITPKLVAQGYNVLQVDQRSGGGSFGSQNRTVKARGKSTIYCPAYADMEGALHYATENGYTKIFAWGSSYSAALSLKLAGEHGDSLAGALAFSPASGKGMGACAANQFISAIKIPTLGLRPSSEMRPPGQAQRELFIQQGLEYFVSEDGVHGSSMLDPSRAKGDVKPTWDKVLAFLSAH